MTFLRSLLKVLLLMIGFVIIAGGTLGSLCGMLSLDVGVTVGGALATAFGVGVFMVANRTLSGTRAEAAERYAELVARHDAARTKAAERQDEPGGHTS